MKVYVPDQTLFVFDVAPPRQYVGAGAYRKDWEDFLNDLDGPVKFDITDLAVVADGNLGYSHSIQHVSGKNKKAEVLDLTVRVTDVYRKIDGHLAGEHGTRLSAGRSQHRNHSSAAVGLQSLHARRHEVAVALDHFPRHRYAAGAGPIDERLGCAVPCIQSRCF